MWIYLYVAMSRKMLKRCNNMCSFVTNERFLAESENDFGIIAKRASSDNSLNAVLAVLQLDNTRDRDTPPSAAAIVPLLPLRSGVVYDDEFDAIAVGLTFFAHTRIEF